MKSIKSTFLFFSPFFCYVLVSCIPPVVYLTTKGRFQIRDLPVAPSVGAEGGAGGIGVGCSSSGQGGQGHTSEEDEYAIPIVQDGRLVP